MRVELHFFDYRKNDEGDAYVYRGGLFSQESVRFRASVADILG